MASRRSAPRNSAGGTNRRSAPQDSTHRRSAPQDSTHRRSAPQDSAHRRPAPQDNDQRISRGSDIQASLTSAIAGVVSSVLRSRGERRKSNSDSDLCVYKWKGKSVCHSSQ